MLNTTQISQQIGELETLLQNAQSKLAELKAALAAAEQQVEATVAEPEKIEEPVVVEVVAETEQPAATEEPKSEVETIAAPADSTRPAALVDLRKSFTLNDKFLFRRELFGGSEQDFSDTLELIASMASLAEAQEYLFDDLQLDRENDTVNEFMGIITNYFVNR